MKDKKIFSLSLIGMMIMLITIIGFSYAMFSFAGTGTKENVIVTGSLTVSYDETSSINLIGQYPMSDILGISQDVAECSINSGTNTTKTLCEQNGGVWYNSTLSFSITGQLGGQGTIYYGLALYDIVEGSILTDDHVKIYLEKNGNVASGFTENTGKDISDFYENSIESEIPSYVVLIDSFATSGTHNYTLKVWVDEDYTLPINDSGAIGDSFYGTSVSETFSFKIKVLAKDEMIGLSNDLIAPVCAFSSGLSTSAIANGETATYVLECTDEGTFNDSDITTSDFTVGGTNGAIAVTNIAKSTITNGYSYTVTVTGTTIKGTGTIRLNAGVVSDIANNTNSISSISEEVTSMGDGIYAYSYNGTDGSDGSAQTFTAPASGYYQLETWGAQGGTSGGTGGNGSYVKGNIYLYKNEVIYIYVGGNGSILTSGYNGAGSGSAMYTTGDAYKDGGAIGGGATDIRCFANSDGRCVNNTSNLNNSDNLGLNSRIIVAAGGGGGAYISANYNGGVGGTISSDSVSGRTITIASSGQTSGYEFGLGQTGLAGGNYSWGESGRGGGGGGYYGGMASQTGANGIAGGAGGSSYISGYLGCVAISKYLADGTTINNTSTRLTRLASDGQTRCTATSAASDISCSYHYSGKIFTSTSISMKSGNETIPTHNNTSTMTGNSGNGYAKIVWVGTT